MGEKNKKCSGNLMKTPLGILSSIRDRYLKLIIVLSSSKKMGEMYYYRWTTSYISEIQNYISPLVSFCH